LPLLRQETDKPKYKNWLFVLGTAVMATFVEETTCPQCGQALTGSVKDSTANFAVTMNGARSVLKCKTCNVAGALVRVGAMIDNVAFVQKGGEKGDKNTYIATKEYISHIDFRRAATTAWSDVANRGSIFVRQQVVTPIPVAGSVMAWSTNKTFGPSKFTDERMGGAVFEIDGIRFGLEICLDHGKNRLGNAANVQIQLVPSAGQKFKQFSIVPNGLYFGVDGLGISTMQVAVNALPLPPITTTTTNVSVGGVVTVCDAVAIS
jgi:hypothetical protein